MNLYYVNSDYISYLRRFDRRVLWNKSHRPYVGIIFKFNEFTYFAPLETAKSGKRVNKRIAVQVWGSSQSDTAPLSFLLLNDMIPINEANYTLVDMEVEKERNVLKYQLMLNEINYIRPREAQITRQASKVYQLKNEKNIDFFNRMCLDFKLLEEKSLLFDR